MPDEQAKDTVVTLQAQHVSMITDEPGFRWFEVAEGDRWVTSIELREEGIWVRQAKRLEGLSALQVCRPEVAAEVAALIADFYGKAAPNA